MAILYVLRNKINGKCYVGQTTQTLKMRLRSHKTNPVGFAIAKYGMAQFEIHHCYMPEALLDVAEATLIQRLAALCPGGYNLSPGGQQRRHVSQETRKKMRAIRLGKKLSPETRRKIGETARRNGSKRGANHPLYGKHPTAETCRKISLAQVGKTMSPEARKQIAQSLRGQVFTQERRDKIAAALRGKTLSKEVRGKIALASHNRIWAEESLRKLSLANIGKTLSAEHRAKLSAAHRGKTLTVEHRRKLAQRFRGEGNPFYGRHLSDYQKQRMAEGRRAFWEKKKGVA